MGIHWTFSEVKVKWKIGRKQMIFILKYLCILCRDKKNLKSSNMQYIQHKKPDGQGNKLLLSKFMLQTIKDLTGFLKTNKIFWKLNILHSCVISWNVYKVHVTQNIPTILCNLNSSISVCVMMTNCIFFQCMQCAWWLQVLLWLQ